jgi:predicted metal-dependent peptidase
MRVQEAVRALIQSDPWYGLTLRHFQYVEDVSCPSIGVGSDGTGLNQRLTLIYSPAFIDTLSQRELMEVLKHEVLHPTFAHLRKETHSRRWNIAQDCAINSLLDQNVIGAICDRIGGYLPGRGELKDLPLLKSADWYHANLPESADTGEGEGTIDHHAPLSEEASRKLRDIIEQTTNKVAESNSWGNVSAELRQHVYNYLSGYDWQSELAHIVARTRDTEVISTRRKLNRRLAHAPGVIRKRIPRILVAIDESGSVDANMWKMLSSALATLSLHCEFTLLPFDCAVAEDKLQKFKKGHTASFGRSLVGGTNFDAPTKYFNEHSSEYDALFIATDGQASAPVECDKRRTWILPDGCSMYFPTDEKLVYVR